MRREALYELMRLNDARKHLLRACGRIKTGNERRKQKNLAQRYLKPAA